MLPTCPTQVTAPPPIPSSQVAGFIARFIAPPASGLAPLLLPPLWARLQPVYLEDYAASFRPSHPRGAPLAEAGVTGLAGRPSEGGSGPGEEDGQLRVFLDVVKHAGDLEEGLERLVGLVGGGQMQGMSSTTGLGGSDTALEHV